MDNIDVAYIATALYSYGPIWLRPYIVMGSTTDRTVTGIGGLGQYRGRCRSPGGLGKGTRRRDSARLRDERPGTLATRRVQGLHSLARAVPQRQGPLPRVRLPRDREVILHRP